MNEQVSMIKCLYLRADIFAFDSLSINIIYSRGSYIIYNKSNLILTLPKKKKEKYYIFIRNNDRKC